MSEPTQRIIESNGIRLNIAEQGKGPLVLLCHGFPESWYSWRNQIGALAAAGFHAVAPDMRGYGKSEVPEAIDQYTIFHLVGDLVGLLDALEARTAVIVGHDWGANIAWQAARLRPDRFRAIAALSVPFRPRSPVRPTSVMPRSAGEVTGLAQRSRHRFLRRRIQALWFPRPSQLLPQRRPQLGADGTLRGRARNGPGTLCRGRSGHGGLISRHGPASRQPQTF